MEITTTPTPISPMIITNIISIIITNIISIIITITTPIILSPIITTTATVTTIICMLTGTPDRTYTSSLTQHIILSVEIFFMYFSRF